MLIISISDYKSGSKEPWLLQIKGTDSPSVLILRAVRTRANRVALNMTVPSLLRGMFIDTRRCNRMQRRNKCRHYEVLYFHSQRSPPWSGFSHIHRAVCAPTLQATLWGQSLPKPSGGWILLSRVTTSRCFMRPLMTTRIQIKGSTPSGAVQWHMATERAVS